MAIRMIALDLDDTFLQPDLSISERNRRAVLESAAQGVTIVIATGRMYRSAKPFADMLGLDIACICYNGALVKTSRSGRVLDADPVPVSSAKRIMSRFMDLDFKINAYVDDQLFMKEETPEGIRYGQIAGVQPIYVGQDLRDWLTDPPYKVLGIADPERLDQIQPQLEKEFEGEVYLTRSKPNYLEALHWGLQKGSSLERLATKMGIAAHEVLAVGDAPNDREMLEWAGTGVAVANAHPFALEAADWVAPDHRDDGVAQAIERFVLNKV